MKIDRSKIKKVPADPPPDTKAVIQSLMTVANDDTAFLKALQDCKSWTVSKCEIYHWVDVLNKFDEILADATTTADWMLSCDIPDSQDSKLKGALVKEVLRFTSMLIEHSFSRQLYNSMDRLITLLGSSDMYIVENVLTLLYTFSKRTSFLTRMRDDQNKELFLRLQLLAETWGGKVNGFGLSKCCEDVPLDQYPSTATTVHFEFFSEPESEDDSAKRSTTNVIHIENVDRLKPKTVPEIMTDLVREYRIPEAKQIPLYFHLRLAYCFGNYKQRLHCVQSRLLALSILAYTCRIPENVSSYIYGGLVEELVDVLQLKHKPELMDLKTIVMRTLTAIVHHDRGSRCNDIIDAMSASSYHGFLPVLVRSCIQALTEGKRDQFPINYATAVFSFLYHLASYESGGDSLVACGMMESMLKVVNWYDTTEENITFVTRAVRVIDLITNMDMQSFHNHNGLSLFTKRLEHEVEICAKEQPDLIQAPSLQRSESVTSDSGAGPSKQEKTEPSPSASKSGTGEQCFPQRVALLKSVLNFLKKIIPDPTFTDSVRHLMDGSLPNSLKHIISNAEYYGSSLFLLAIDIVTVYVFHEPAMLSALQDRGLTDVILQAVLLKDLPPTKEVLSAIPNICSALCLNSRGLQAFVALKPFEKLFKVLLMPDYLPAMRRRRTGESYGDTATGLGSAVDELMRHQPSLRAQAMQDIVKLLNDLCAIGRDPNFIAVGNGTLIQSINRVQRADQSIPGDSDSEDEDFEDSQQGTAGTFHTVPSGLQMDTVATQESDMKEKTPVPLLDYIVHVTKFVEAVLTSNSTDDHCREFIRQDGLKPLMEIFRLPNLPLDFPYSNACHAAYTLVKSVVAYCRDHLVLEEAFTHMELVLKEIKACTKPVPEPGGSAMLNEWARTAPNIDDALKDPQRTPLLHRLCYMHSYVSMMAHICKLNQSDIRIICTNSWATEKGLKLLQEIADLYSFLIWENTILIALCSDEGLLPQESDISRTDLKLILANRKGAVEEEKPSDENSSGGTPMDVDEQPSTSVSVPPAPVAVSRKTSTNGTRPQIHIVKLLKPLITVATKLCRVTGELLSLMVKFCVNPARQRRQAIGSRNGEVPSSSARQVATTIAGLMTQVLNKKGPLSNPPARFRLNYLICVLTFIQPLIFDEKRFAFHYMLQKFIAVGTVDAFFGIFENVMKGPSVESDINRSVTEKTMINQFIVDFVVAWLSLLEKLINPKAVMETPNVLPPSRIAISGYAPFDPAQYYIKMLHHTLQVVDRLLSVQTLKSFGESTGDLLLTILSHIMKIEAIIKEKAPEVSAAAAPEAGPPGPNAAAPAPEAPPAPPGPTQQQQALMDMGFQREAAVEALEHTNNNVEQAADYLLNYQNERVLRTAGMRLMDVDFDNAEDEIMLQAIAMSIGDRDTGAPSADGASSSSALAPQVPPTAPTPQQIEALIDKALPLCVDLVDYAPECVFKVADLISVISKRNGNEWRLRLIRKLGADAVMFATTVVNNADAMYTGTVTPPADVSFAKLMRSSAESQKLTARLHLLCILLQDNQEDCGKILDGDSLIPLLINLISAARRIYGMVARGMELVPKWLAFAFLILDSYEKMCAMVKRKEILQKYYTPTWKWLDVRLGKWTAYSEQNNKEINDAYERGMPTCKLTGQGAGPVRQYIVRFKDMVQVTDSSGSRRPIMRELKKREAKPVEKPTESSDDGSAMQTDQDQAEEKPFALMSGLNKEQKFLLINDIVSLVHQKLDPDTLQAAMRVLLRFTRDYDSARHFAELKGPQILLGLDRRSFFESFSSFLTHLIRHIIENGPILEHSMEKFCSWLTYGVVSQTAGTNYGSHAVREGNYIMRICWPGAARNPELFVECAKRTIQFNTPAPTQAAAVRTDDPNSRTDLIKPSPPKFRNKAVSSDQSADYKTALKLVMAELLNLLVVPWEPEGKPELKKDGKEGAGAVSERISLLKSSVHQLQQMLQTTQSGDAAATSSSVNGSSLDAEHNIWKASEKAKKPVMNKSVTLRVIAELIKSYSLVAEFVLGHTFSVDQGGLIKEENVGALAFILDNFVHMAQKAGDEYCPHSTRVLMAALASACENPRAQMQAVEEVKQALYRATLLPETQEKHERIGALANIIHTMVDACPTRVADPNDGRKVQYVVNQMARFMAKRNLINDLAKIPHCLDLRSPHLAVTVNAILRPLEILTRLASQQDKPKSRTRHSSVAVTNTLSTAGNAEAADLTRVSAVDESQRTENDVAPISDEALNMSEAAEMGDIFLRAPAMEIDMDNPRGGSDDEDGDRPPPRHSHRINELEVSMDDDDSETEENDINQRRSPGRITDEEQDEADEDEEMHDEDDDEDDEEEDEEDDEDDDDELVEPGVPVDNNGAGGMANLYHAAFGAVEWDEEQNPDDDMLLHLEDLFPGAAVHAHAHHGILDQPLVFEVNTVGPGGLAQEIQGGDMGGRQLPPPLSISSSHPLLSRPPAGAEVAQGAAAGALPRIGLGAGVSEASLGSRGLRTLRVRTNLGRGGLGAGTRAINPGPAILQRLLGPTFRIENDMIVSAEGGFGAARAMRDPRALFWDEPEYSSVRPTEQEDLVLMDDPIFLGNTGLVATLPSLVRRWSEEARVLDGDNVIESADMVKPFIFPDLEVKRDEIMKNMKKPETTDTATSPISASRADASVETQATAGSSTAHEDALNFVINAQAVRDELLDDIARMQEHVELQAEAVAALSQAVVAQAMNESDSENSEDYSSHLSEDTDGELQDAAMALTDMSTEQTTPAPSVPAHDLLLNASGAPNPVSPAEMAVNSPAAEADAGLGQVLSVPPTVSSNVLPTAPPAASMDTTGGQDISVTTAAEGTSTETASSSDQGPSTSNNNNYPEGIDPSFLEALPENMRQEVIADYLRMQRVQQQNMQTRAAASSNAAPVPAAVPDPSQPGPSSGVPQPQLIEISPEFLAALPPNIQEEVLAQQRLEQARLAAQNAAPDAPFDPANFLQSLAPSLRRQILADIDDSMLTVLPDTVAQEARTLRRDMEQRHIFHGGLAFEGDVIAFMRGRYPTLRSRGGLTGRPYTTNFATRGGGTMGRRQIGRLRMRAGNAGGPDQWYGAGLRSSGWSRATTGTGTELSRNADLESMGKNNAKPILDFEALACLLVLYFLNAPAVNVGRLQRIFRNICHHIPTREWVFDAVMSMLKKADDSKAQEAKKVYSTIKPNWLNISIDAALGCRANVFQLMPKQLKKPQTAQTPLITIHPQAAQIVCTNLLDCLMLMAKNFPEQFVPYAIRHVAQLGMQPSLEKSTPDSHGSNRNSKSPSRGSARSHGVVAKGGQQDFWEVLVKLDAQVGSGLRKSGKVSSRMSSAGPTSVLELGPDEPLRMTTFVNSGLGQLITMLLSETFHKIPDLSDRLLRLIASIANNVHKRDLGIPVMNSAVSKTARGAIRPGKLSKKDREMVVWKAAITRYFSLGSMDLSVQPPVPIVETEGGDYAATTAEVEGMLTKFLAGLDPQADLYDLKDQISTAASELSQLSSPGAIKFSLSVEFEQCEEICSLLRELVNVLIARRCSEEGLENITHTLIVLAQRFGSSVRQAIGQMLLNGIRQLAVDVCKQIESLMKEAATYNAQKSREKTEESEESPESVSSDGSAKGIISDRFSTGESVVLYKSKGKAQAGPEVHLTAMSNLTGKSSCQTFMLKLLKMMIDLRGNSRTFLRSRAGDKAEECPNGTVNSLARRLLEISYRQRQRKSSPQPSTPIFREQTPTPMDVDVTNHEEPGAVRTTESVGVQASPSALQPQEPEVDLPPMSELLSVDDLWTYLSLCLSELEKTGDQNAVLILQPTVESFFLVHATERKNADTRLERARSVTQEQHHAAEEAAAPPSPGAAVSGEASTVLAEQGMGHLPLDVRKFLHFAETHKVVLNQILRQSTVPLSDGPFAVLVDHTRVLDFDVKRKYFRHELDKVDADAHRMRREDLALRIRRSVVFEDSFRDLHRRSPEEWKARFYIMFEGEEGQDAGGLLREWYSIISREIFNPMYALFRTSPGDRVTYMINSHSAINTNHLQYFKFVGRLIAKAIYDNKLLDCYFTRSFYKHILGKPVKYTDMESEDYSFYQGLVYLLNHSVEEVGSDLTFSTEVQEFGATEVRDLKPNGRNIPVTNETKHEYVRLACQMKMTQSIRKQLDSFLEGFYEVIPKRLISIFNEQELELLISGLPNIDIDDLKSNTDYHKYQASSLQIQWFWRALRSFDQADRAKFLQFVTGTSKVPLNGFAALEGMSGAQKFQIHRDDRSTDRLPSAHTCFNQLDLPAYETYDKLRTMLLTAIHECSEGFGFA
ncbi:E3 ubiquitin-protein ligase HUWE1-like isoform X2 [Paramacrobiotus metropolitanus]|uniref:E3 ubiquitin-protein ligase HUWE1-like isoform X2 n=1 Tax=Paramacrobiotus metropolitanus TaxID=2943436 RepID=UPI002445A435|nr:E3 ubiquitin-protein ligase HUWE1-like isoform X2 [Paramacrobiotus metropolitanus]